jgi:hypothetical protein
MMFSTLIFSPKMPVRLTTYNRTLSSPFFELTPILLDHSAVDVTIGQCDFPFSSLVSRCRIPGWFHCCQIFYRPVSCGPTHDSLLWPSSTIASDATGSKIVQEEENYGPMAMPLGNLIPMVLPPQANLIPLWYHRGFPR